MMWFPLLILAQTLTMTPSPVPTETAWATRANVQAVARRLACPNAPVGCFAEPPDCVPSVCYCPRVCSPAANGGRVWQKHVGDCVCGM